MYNYVVKNIMEIKTINCITTIHLQKILTQCFKTVFSNIFFKKSLISLLYQLPDGKIKKKLTDIKILNYPLKI